MEIYVDADACPVKEEVLRVADRHGLVVHMVSNGGIRPSTNPRVKLVIVPSGLDVADDWIAERIGPGDIAITNDIPLADRCLKAGGVALRPNGAALTRDSIGMALATRNLMTDLRDSGQITGGPRAFAAKDRSEFLNALEKLVRASLRG
ncbi:MAG: hypothetical protein A2516_01405 [Alphaproteobacteria bacterium RIFOXYD12_FULL_60_8]|nr:MAG: hypothetical protein A2516_01405 [Alphaproteobacteria bacterium RIFOXYD12_FULL_60_8]